MRKSVNNLSCVEFQRQLPDLIGSGESITDHPHIHSCRLCRALLADLEAIAEAARQMFPNEEPPDALWGQIEFAIEHEEAAPDRH
jgi:hypothetical protein